MCECVHAQTFVAFLLVVNFGINIVETEIPDMSRETSNTFDSIDHAFTIFYVLELMLNLFVNWFWPFVTNGWSLFDTLAVTMSVIGALLNTIDPGHSNNDLSVIRSVRMYVTLECMLHSNVCYTLCTLVLLFESKIKYRFQFSFIILRLTKMYSLQV